MNSLPPPTSLTPSYNFDEQQRRFQGDNLNTSKMSSDPESGTPHPKIDGNDTLGGEPHPAHEAFLSWLSRDNRKTNSSALNSLFNECVAEAFGTMFIVLFGVGSVCSAVLLKDDSVPVWHVTVIWGFGIALAILATASVSGAHLNPAVSLALALFRPRDFPFKKLLPFWFAQYLGGVLGGAFNLMIFGPAYDHIEKELGFARGSVESIKTAKTFGEYFPAPGGNLPDDVVSMGFAFLVEAWGTGILMFMILAITDPRQKIIRNKEMIPFYIGFTVAVVMTLYAPFTQTGLNPARDFGPRLVAVMAGWGSIAIPGPRNGFWLYIVGPKIGAVVGAFVYDGLIRPGLS